MDFCHRRMAPDRKISFLAGWRESLLVFSFLVLVKVSPKVAPRSSLFKFGRRRSIGIEEQVLWLGFVFFGLHFGHPQSEF